MTTPDPPTPAEAAEHIEAVLQPRGRCTECGGGEGYWKHGTGDPLVHHPFQVPAPLDAPDPLRAALLNIEALRPPPNLQGSPVNAYLRAVEAAAAILRAALDADTAPLDGQCWFCKQAFVVDALIAGYDTWDEQRLACLACNERMDGNWRPRP